MFEVGNIILVYGEYRQLVIKENKNDYDFIFLKGVRNLKHINYSIGEKTTWNKCLSMECKVLHKTNVNISKILYG